MSKSHLEGDSKPMPSARHDILVENSEITDYKLTILIFSDICFLPNVRKLQYSHNFIRVFQDYFAKKTSLTSENGRNFVNGEKPA